MATSPEYHTSSSNENSDAERDESTMMKTLPQRSLTGGTNVGPVSHHEKTAPSEHARVKRKKAKRACNNCQRAHLTCDDNRPCERCVARGLSQDCQDGVRKKAKYLHDAPDEALRPKAARDIFNNQLEDDSTKSRQMSTIAPNNEAEQQPPMQPIQRQNSYPYPQGTPGPSVSSQMDENPSFGVYGPQSQQGLSQFSPQRQASLPNLGSDPMQSVHTSPPLPQQFGGPMFNPADPTLFQFDLAGMNFGSHYGALEFGILSQLSSGINDPYILAMQDGNTPANYDNQNMRNTEIIDPSGSHGGFALPNPKSPIAWQNSAQEMGFLPERFPPSVDSLQQSNSMNAYGYPLGSGKPNMPEPDSNLSSTDLYGSAIPSSRTAVALSVPVEQNSSHRKTQSPYIQGKHNATNELQKLEKLPPAFKIFLKTPSRNPSTVYDSVNKPYPYTAGFHAMTAVLQRRFSTQERLAIAKALASIRPSFILCTRNLDFQDLIFMERCFQRQLFEYEQFVNACGTPTLICRRTGEVAYVGEEFTALTGWPKQVLLGKEPNMNLNNSIENRGSTVSTISSRGGFNTPRVTNDGMKLDNPHASGGQTTPLSGSSCQAVFLAELLDADSVVQFYKDFAKLAFADSKGKAMSPCKLLKYKARNSITSSGTMDALSPNVNGSVGNNATTTPSNGIKHERQKDSAAFDGISNRSTHAMTMSMKRGRPKSSVKAAATAAPATLPMQSPLPNEKFDTSISQQKSDEAGEVHGHELLIGGKESLRNLGEPGGKIDCMYCWTVKRDVFDIPMLVVIHFLPILKDTTEGP